MLNLTDLHSKLVQVQNYEGDYLATLELAVSDVEDAINNTERPQDEDARFWWDDNLVEYTPFGPETRRIVDENAGGVTMYVSGTEAAVALVSLLNQNTETFPVVGEDEVKDVHPWT